MITILTSSLGGYIKEDEKRIPTPLLENNGLLEMIRSCWKENSKVMMITASPDEYEKNDDKIACMRESFPLSGLTVSSIEMCDGRRPELARSVPDMDVLILMGGHVPTENAWFRQLKLRERLNSFNGLILAYSAGSMNCADMVYAAPELPGEATDPEYERWISGLGLTDINIFPHFQWLRDEMLDGFRMIEDITYADSMGHEIIALNDGSYIVVDGTGETLYGEAYRILDGKMEKICEDGGSLVLR